MNLEDKQKLIQTYAEPCKTAIESLIDTLLNTLAPVTIAGSNLEINESLFKDEKALNEAKKLKEDIEVYEKLRGKINSGDFNLSLLEIGRINVALTFCSKRSQHQIETMVRAKGMIDSLILGIAEEKRTLNEVTSAIENIFESKN